MTVADLIHELQARPGHLPVLIVMRSVLIPEVIEINDDGARPILDYRNPREETLDDSDAVEADEVRYEGTFVLIRGG